MAHQGHDKSNENDENDTRQAQSHEEKKRSRAARRPHLDQHRRRRGAGEGSIYQRSDGLWVGVADLGEGGTGRRRKYIYGKTQRQVREKLTAALGARDQGLPVATQNERMSVEQYLRIWLETMRPPRVREATWLRNETHLRLHVYPAIGRLRLRELSRLHLQQLYASCLAKGLSPTTVNHLHGVLHQALKDAIRSDLVARNVAALADPPPVAKREMHIYTPEQVETLLEQAMAADRDPALAPLVALTVATGMRTGEVLSLRWEHVDLARGVVHVTRTRTRMANGYADGTPKTAAGTRDIVLVGRAVEALRTHRVRQAHQRLFAGGAWLDEDRVFPSARGTAMDPANLRKQWLRLLASVRSHGLPALHFHDLRHSAASWLLAAGVPVTDVATILGHADPSITYRIYAHALPGASDRVAAAMEQLLPRVREARQEHEAHAAHAAHEAAHEKLYEKA